MQNNSLTPIIGITGGIGSGKSLVCRIFSCLGIPVFDSDATAKKLIQEPMLKNQIIGLMGPEAYNEAGVYQSDFVRKRIIEQPPLREALNQIVHPAVREEAIRFQSQLPANTPFALYESALITKENKPPFVSKIILINSDVHTRIKRLASRGLPEIEIKKLIDLQEKIYENNLQADFVIENQENSRVLPQVLKIVEKLLIKN